MLSPQQIAVRQQVFTAYDIQKLRIAMGGRISAKEGEGLTSLPTDIG
jgi:hypothetical protein